MKKKVGLFLVFVSFFVTSLFFTQKTFAIECHSVEGQNIAYFIYDFWTFFIKFKRIVSTGNDFFTIEKAHFILK